MEVGGLDPLGFVAMFGCGFRLGFPHIFPIFGVCVCVCVWRVSLFMT